MLRLEAVLQIQLQSEIGNANSEICVDGQADSLKSMVDTPFGKVGGLNCWEHIQPLLRYYEYSQGVEIHVAGWPAFWNPPKDTPVRHFWKIIPLFDLEVSVTDMLLE